MQAPRGNGLGQGFRGNETEAIIQPSQSGVPCNKLAYF